jgi:hypothetical protein
MGEGVHVLITSPKQASFPKAQRSKAAQQAKQGRPHVSQHVGRPPVAEVAKVGAQEARLPLKALAVGGGLFLGEEEGRAGVPFLNKWVWLVGWLVDREGGWVGGWVGWGVGAGGLCRGGRPLDLQRRGPCRNRHNQPAASTPKSKGQPPTCSGAAPGQKQTQPTSREQS